MAYLIIVNLLTYKHNKQCTSPDIPLNSIHKTSKKYRLKIFQNDEYFFRNILSSQDSSYKQFSESCFKITFIYVYTYTYEYIIHTI